MTTLKKIIADKHKDESMHAYNAYSGDNWLFCQKIGYIKWGSYRNISWVDIEPYWEKSGYITWGFIETYPGDL